MLPRFCTFARRACRTNTLNQLRKCADIHGESLPQSSAGLRNYCAKPDTIVDKNSSTSAAVVSPLRGYGSTQAESSETQNDNKNVETNECTRIASNNVITAVPELLSEGKNRSLDDDIELQMPDALDECTEDVSHVGPYRDPPRTFAYMAESSSTVQQLVDLGVKMYKLEKDYKVFKEISELNFDYAIKPKIQFLHDNGVVPDDLGKVISNCPQLLTTSQKILDSRIAYLHAHKFTKDMIGMIISKNPSALMLHVKKLDEQLGFLQQSFHLTGNELRGVVSHQPRLATWPARRITYAIGYITNVLKFNKYQMKEILLARPSVYVKSIEPIVDTCMFAIEKMKLDRKEIINNSALLLCKKPKLERRHRFLVELNKAQYDSKLPGYIPPAKIVTGTDEVFCKEVANCDINLYNAFLKTF